MPGPGADFTEGWDGQDHLHSEFAAVDRERGAQCRGRRLRPTGYLDQVARRREQTAAKRRDVQTFDILPANINDWGKVLEAIRDYDLALIDMLPSVDHCIAEVHGICGEADLIMVTTGATMSDLDSTGPWIEQLLNLGFNVTTCMNRANRRETFFEAARAQLNRLGPLCPVEVRHLSDAHAYSIDGLAAVDRSKSKARSDFAAVWDYLRREMKVEVQGE